MDTDHVRFHKCNVVCKILSPFVKIFTLNEDNFPDLDGTNLAKI